MIIRKLFIAKYYMLVYALLRLATRYHIFNIVQKFSHSFTRDDTTSDIQKLWMKQCTAAVCPFYDY